MKYLVLSLSLVVAACGQPENPFPEPTVKLEPGTSSFDVTVSSVKVGKGTVYCALHVTAEGYPGPSPIIGGTAQADPHSADVKCLYTGLPAGTYALSSFQDENSNGKLDTNVFGAPTEGYGASKNVLPPAAPPTFEDNQITLVDGQTAAVTMNLK